MDSFAVTDRWCLKYAKGGVSFPISPSLVKVLNVSCERRADLVDEYEMSAFAASVPSDADASDDVPMLESVDCAEVETVDVDESDGPLLPEVTNVLLEEVDAASAPDFGMLLRGSECKVTLLVANDADSYAPVEVDVDVRQMDEALLGRLFEHVGKPVSLVNPRVGFVRGRRDSELVFVFDGFEF